MYKIVGVLRREYFSLAESIFGWSLFASSEHWEREWRVNCGNTVVVNDDSYVSACSHRIVHASRGFFLHKGTVTGPTMNPCASMVDRTILPFAIP